MASRFSVEDVLQQLDGNDAGFSDDGSDSGGEGIAGYLPDAAESQVLEREELDEPLDVSHTELEPDTSGDGEAILDPNDSEPAISSTQHFDSSSDEGVPESSDDVDMYEPEPLSIRPVRGQGRRGRSSRGRRGRGSSRGSVRGSGSSRGSSSGTSARGGRGRGRGRGRRDPHEGLSARERAVLCGEWKRSECNAYVIPFTGPTPGPAVPRVLFERFYTDEVWDMLVNETNKYAAQQRQLASSPGRPWHDVCVAELKAFVGMQIAMGVCRLPRITMYWSQHNLLTPGLSRVMPLTRFQQICRYIHLNDSACAAPHGQPGNDPLYKLRKMLDLITPLLESQYNPPKELSIDEAMIPFKGRLGFKQYMKDKPTKWGIKVFVLADARNGYVYRMQIYTGKNSNLDSDVGLCSRVVLELVEGLEHTCPSIFMDNYYTSPWLFLKLYDKDVNACGTARRSRKYYPPALDVKSKDVESGFYDYRSSGPLLACVWKDKRIIHFLSTMHVAEAQEEATVMRRRHNDGRRVSVTCPPCLVDYQQFMQGVDHSDQMINYYNSGRRSVKWWKRGLSHILEVCILNAYTLHQFDKIGSSRQDSLSFRTTLADELIGSFTSRTRSIGLFPATSATTATASATALRLDNTKPHLPVFGSKRDCAVCTRVGTTRGQTRKQYRHESHIQCATCNVHLCICADRNCFAKYHTERNYWQ